MLNLKQLNLIDQTLSSSRIANTLRQIQHAIPKAKESVEDDIVGSNRDKAILGIANFLGSKLYKSLYLSQPRSQPATSGQH